MQSHFQRSAFFLTCAAAVATLFSIAVTNILMALAFAAFLLSGDQFRFPPIRLPLALFAVGTVVSLALSDDPWAGRPQLRKFFVYLMLLLVASTIRSARDAMRLMLACAAVGTVSAIRALAQFLQQLELCQGSYGCFVGERITGFMSHWMTFGGEMMMTLLMLTAWLLYGPKQKRAQWAWILCGVIIAAAIFANGTRSVWLATACGGAYLVWFWRRWLVLAGPLVLLAALFLAPSVLRQRFTSAFQPHGELDSNSHRRVTWRTGLRMVQAHPVFGLGPELMKKPEVFRKYVPPDVTRLPEGWYGHLHNIYLHYSAERGIPTMLMLLWMLGKMTADWVRGLRRYSAQPGEHQALLRGAIAVMIAILVEGIFELNLGDSEVLMLFLAVTGCAYAALVGEPEHART